MDAYERFAEKLDQTALGAPRTPELLQILRELFRPEEAELALALAFRPTPLARVVEATGREPEELRAALEAMADRGLLFARTTDRGPAYTLLPLYPGLIELQFMGGQGGPAKTRLAHLFERYYVGGMGQALAGAETRYSRVVPVERRIPAGMEIHPYEQVSQLIREGDTFALATCYCRHEKELLGQGCGAPKDVCMVFGPFAEFAVERGFARAATREEMLAALDRAEAHGLVHVTDNVTDRIGFLCNCCGCCCGFLRTLTQLGRPNAVAASRYTATLDPSACAGCGACAELCQLGALTVDGDEARLDPERCLGCGCCVTACPTGALALTPRADHLPPRRDRWELDAAVRAERTTGAPVGFQATDT